MQKKKKLYHSSVISWVYRIVIMFDLPTEILLF